VQGFDLTAANAVLGTVGAGGLANSGSAIEPHASQGGDNAPAVLRPLPYATWQCGGGYAEVSGRTELARVDLSSDVRPWSQEAQVVAVEGAGDRAHALVVWVDYEAPAELGGHITLGCNAPDAAGGPVPGKQGVLLLTEPVQPCTRFTVRTVFDPACTDEVLRFHVVRELG
jgi:hypothetical protein